MKTGLVVEGGATRAYYSVGVMDCLYNNGIYADYFIGVSAGIANGLSYISKQPGRNLIIGTEHNSKKEYMGFSHLIKTGNYYNIDYVFNKIPNELLPFDYDTFYNYKGEVYGCVTNLDTGLCEYFDMKKCSKDIKEVLASCALPLLFKPVEINGKLYYDGGISNSIPFKKALDDGCDKVIVILTRDRDYIKKTSPTVKISAQFFNKHKNFKDAMLKRADMYNKQRAELFELEKQGKVLVICPEDTSDWKRIDNSGEFVEKIYNQGYLQTEKMFDTIRDYLGI